MCDLALIGTAVSITGAGVGAYGAISEQSWSISTARLSCGSPVWAFAG